MSEPHKPRGILRNKGEGSPTDSQRAALEELDRQEVINNTRLNAQLASDSSKGEQIRAKIAEKKAEQGIEDDDDDVSTHSPPPEHLKWDEINLYKTEQEKNSTMKIDEPKTPYEGGFDPEGEYYKDDADEIPAFELGESELSGHNEEHANGLQSLNGGQIIEDPNQREEEEEEEPQEQLTAEERHKKFEEMRKQHYHLKGNALKHKIDIPDEDNE